jgi:2-methylisocitrate lyase-like PEP mutase family enzyme
VAVPALKQAIENGELVMAPGAWDAITGRLFCHMGFGAVYIPLSQTAKVLGTHEDVLSLAEVAMVAERVSEGVRDELPVIVDAGGGFGSTAHVVRAVEMLEDAGASAVQLSDAAVPRGEVPGGAAEIVSLDSFRERIEAAVKARRSSDLLVLAATHATGEDAAARARAALEAGTDVVVAPSAYEERLRPLAGLLPGVRLGCYAGLEGPGTSELAAMGYRLVLFPDLSLQASLLGVQATWKSVADTGYLLAQRAEAMPLINKLLEIEEKWAVEQSTTEAGVEVPATRR